MTQANPPSPGRISSAAQSPLIPETADLPYQTMSEMFTYLAAEGAEQGGDPLKLDDVEIKRSYAICLVPRSGSTFLAHLLKETEQFGFPNEWLAVALAEDQARQTGSGDWDTLFRRIMARHASKNGVSGIELALAHLTWGRQATRRHDVLNPSWTYFYLRRRNIVRQAISMHVAHQSGVLHSFQMSDDARTVRDAVLYDTLALRNWIKFMQDEELKWEREFGRIGIEPIRLYYEDITARPERAVRLFSNALGLPETPVVKASPIERVGTSRTDEWEARYREEDADFLAGLVMHRPFVHTPVSMS
ncbi:Stf0 family sulfotransferase [Maricaulis sp.]|uniref:Stf0 family sulfotransferase n=1 Tax=Maricaulis sp. TaxID=1486257 RepID=UPI0025EF67C0|nr:Stf0 family sulfotransferase [Maricaulis sp.]MDF1768126.1 Stf0 family sulfotransferase [Maricaulis sp.]